MIKGLLSATTVVCLLVLLPATASASVACRYFERGEPGDRDNVLRIRATDLEDLAAVNRAGDDIRVRDDRTGILHACGGLGGPVPTVHNVDLITFVAEADGAGIFVSLAGGRFAPGASPEPSSVAPEIEMAFRSVAPLPGNIGIGGSQRSDRVSVSTGDDNVLINLNRDQDRDADVTFDRRIVGVLLRGGKGADVFNGAGITRPRGPSLSVYAGPGNDRIFGGAAGDILYGRAGRDVIAGMGGADEVDCGPGNDLARIEPGDHVTRCETERAERALSFP